MNDFQIYNAASIDKSSQAYSYFHRKYTEKLHSIVSTVQNFTAKIRHDIFHSYSIDNEKVTFEYLLSKSRDFMEQTPEDYTHKRFKSMISSYI